MRDDPSQPEWHHKKPVDPLLNLAECRASDLLSSLLLPTLHTSRRPLGLSRTEGFEAWFMGVAPIPPPCELLID